MTSPTFPELPPEAAEVDRFYKLEPIAKAALKALPEDSDLATAANHDVLLFSFHILSPWEDGSISRFGMLGSIGDSGWPDINKLQDEVIDHCRSRLENDDNLIVKSHFADIIWCARKDHKMARTAIGLYTELYQDQVDRRHFELATDVICRAAILAWQLKDKRAALKIEELISSALISGSLGIDTIWQLSTFVSKNIQHFEDSKIAKFAEALQRICNSQDLSNPDTDFYLLRELAGHQAKIHVALKNDEDAQNARIAIGKYLEADARSRPGDKALVVAGLLTGAIDHYNSIGEPDMARSLAGEALTAGRETENNMGEITSEIELDLDPFLQAIRKAIEVSQQEALLLLGISDALRPIWENAVRAEAEMKAGGSLMSFLPSTTYSDDRPVNTASTESEIAEANI
ncbi:MAG: hypothetical protein HQ477_11940 [Chloroflexi bacterium]|nr:hypothetical protein [Chloroflexota bacterium]